MTARSVLRKIGDALRLLALSPDERAYLRLLKSSPEFDRAYYLASNPRLHPLFKLFPERHYLREGEAMGLMPNPQFSPYAYLAFNPDLKATLGGEAPSQPVPGALPQKDRKGRDSQGAAGADMGARLGPEADHPKAGHPKAGHPKAGHPEAGHPEAGAQGGSDIAPKSAIPFVPARRAIRPLEHYLTQGAQEGRSGYDPPDPSEGLEAPPPPSAPQIPAAVAVVLHLYYPELWPEFAERLSLQQFDFDLFVTLTGPAARGGALEQDIRAVFPKAAIWRLGNRGRDILPFVRLVNAGLLAPYRAVCKLHGKVSPHRRDGARWRQDLVSAVLGAPAPTAAALSAFLADPQAGLWLAEGHILSAPEDWGANLAPLRKLLARRPGPAVPIEAFPAGSIWWAKAPVLAQLAALHLTPEDFEPERGLVDATMAHVIERAMGPLTLAAGLDLRSKPSLIEDFGGQVAEGIGQTAR